ncbi:MAG: leucine-rich repeat protein [Clostridia bacterium]|nr:leucine-rich repeat protein [Clostridia bacterium]
MKKSISLALAALFLSGCVNAADGTASQSTADTETPIYDEVPTLDDVALGAAQQKVSYYQSKVAELEQEILSLKTAFYEERVVYEERIRELEAALATGGGTDAEQTQFQYTVADGMATVTAYLGRETSVVIPERLGDSAVVSVADRAFENNLTVTSVTIPEGVRHIGWFAFSGCVFLKQVTLPASLTQVDYGAFQNCPADLTVTCPDGSYAEAYAISYGFAIK